MKKSNCILTILLMVLFQQMAAETKNADLQLLCDNRVDPVGVKMDELVFSWITEINPSPSWYRIVVASSPEQLRGDKFDLWDSGRREGADGYRIPYQGKKLQPGEKYFWKVQVGGKANAQWSRMASFVTELDAETDWAGAQWISYSNLPASERLVPGIHVHENANNLWVNSKTIVPMFRKQFELKKPVRQALLFISGLGHYTAFANGKPLDDRLLAPGWTHYDKQVLFNSYDITSQLQKGENVIAAIVGNGFHYIGSERYHKLMIAFGHPKLLCLLKITYEDNTTRTIVSDGSWKTAPSAFTFSSIYGGETYDARLEQKGWDRKGFNDSGWKNVQLAEAPSGSMEPETMYPLKVMQRFQPQREYALDNNSYTIDFGQNASGIIAVKVQGKRGDTIRFRPGELLAPDKRVNQKASGSPYYFEYVLKGDGVEYWEPRFSYYGFRYLTVEGAGKGIANGSPKVLACELLHLRNSAPSTGSFRCSSDLLNRIYSLIDWAIRSNMQSSLTDCPHREKLGWLEQSYLMGNSIRYNYDVYHLYRKKIRDMMHAQRENGLIPDIAPEYVVFSDGFVDSPEWGSAGILLPWMVYKWYGDRTLLGEAYPMMTRYIAYLASKADQHILSHGLGDWFDYGPNPPGVAQLTPIALTATAIYYKDVYLVSQIAELLGKPSEAVSYQRKADSIRSAFNKRFYDPIRKTYSTGSQTALAMPLCLNIPEESERGAVYQSLVNTVKRDGYALTAGDIGFHFLVEALSAPEYSELLFRMINRDDVPGYGFQLAKGATALTESWPALEEVSNNHLMLGHLMEWFYTSVLGIIDAPDAVASDKMILRPTPVGDLTSAEGHYRSPRSTVKVSWKKTESGFEMKCSIPATMQVQVVLPAGYSLVQLTEENQVKVLPAQPITVSQGEYTFRAYN